MVKQILFCLQESILWMQRSSLKYPVVLISLLLVNPNVQLGKCDPACPLALRLAFPNSGVSGKWLHSEDFYNVE